MAFSDPQKVKVDGSTEVTLPRVNSGNFASQYESADSLINLKISTANGRRKRHVARIDLSKIIASTLNPSQNEEASASAYIVVDRPLSGYSNAELKKLVEGLVGFLSASSYSATEKLLGSES
uniref:Uncharacterized protein n=1 Tax=Leviviridae sp. TaxID=2027243 RepID=A0A514D1E0_9VIRU|nr:MAG: hypothetical protein H2Bulk36125e5881_000002 [Leviviridae sp.]